MSSIFTNIDKLTFTSEEKTELRIFFIDKDTTKVEEVLSSITKDEEKVEFLRKYKREYKPRGKPLCRSN
jgi:hypothetical protein